MRSKTEEAGYLLRYMTDIDDDLIAEANPFDEVRRCESRNKDTSQKSADSACQFKKMLPKIFLVAAILALPAGAWGYSKLSDAVHEKVAEAQLSGRDMQTISEGLSEHGWEASEVEDLEPLGKNANGQTYGPEALAADLVLVDMDEGGQGYVYKEDLLKGDEEGALVLDAYQSDGITKAGHFTMSSSE